LTAGANAQSFVHQHSIGVGLERIGLDGPDDIGNRYLLRYARHFRNDRLVLVSNLGYVNALNRRYLQGAGDYYVTGKPRERFTADVTLAFDFIKHPRHAFRLGAGPSLWYRRDEPLGAVNYTVSSGGEVTNVRAQWQPLIKELNYGFNVLVEYEYALTDRVLASASLKFVDLERAGPSSIYGLGLGYRLR
jgi:hypothetical protein